MTWLVVGAGASGLGAAALLRTQKQRVVISDQQVIKGEKRQFLNKLQVTIKDGRTDLNHLEGIDQGLILSPGISDDHPLVEAARKRQILIQSEIDLALKAFHGKVVGVSGTNGKSTTVTMLGYLLKLAGIPTSVAGNIGTPPSQLIANGQIEDTLVLELSSYQLALSQAIAPEVAIITSLSPDHLSRHKNIENYLKAKWQLFAKQAPTATAIIAEEAWLKAKEFRLPAPPSQVHILNQALAAKVFPEITPETALLHNRLNATAAVLATSVLTARPYQELRGLLAGFQGLPHRCQKIGTIKQKAVFNDSKATNVASTLVALEGQRAPVVLLLGGAGKGESFSPLAQAKDKIAKIIAFGAAAKQIEEELAGICPLVVYPKLQMALKNIALEIADYPHVLLFSPACASFDEFTNFEERGLYFSQALTPLLDPV